MKVLALTLLCLVAVATAMPEKRIVGGENADIYSHPHIASLQLRHGRGLRHLCGGSIISTEWILTAAHCVDFITDPAHLFVEVGAMNLYEEPNEYEQTIGVAEIIYHEGWLGDQEPGMPNDIAVLRLSAPITLNKNVQVAKMAAEGSSFAVGSNCILSGWGKISGNGSGAKNLKEVSITKISSSECNNLWFHGHGDFINEGHICVLDNNLTSACSGDSGGPMMCGDDHEFLAGVTSWGMRTCAGTMPSVYTRVSHYLDWIKEKSGVDHYN